MDTDRNLLFGVLALQADLLDAARFAEACTAWTARKDVPLADLLIERGWITPTDKADIERLLQRKLTKHSGDTKASLAAVADDEVQRVLAMLEDPDIAASLAGLSSPGSPMRLTTVDLPPETRARYTLTRLHARGGIGQVWLARDGSLGREVALKELRPEQADKPVLWARFLEEAQITGQLEHPGIVPIYELARRPRDDQPFYTMRFVKGRTLSEAIKTYHEQCAADTAGPLAQRALLTAFLGVCNAVAYAHSRGVVHRDLKGANVVLGDFGEVIVLDWGLAKVLGRPDSDVAPPVVLDAETEREATVQGQVLGTPTFMAPEQADGRQDLIDARTDVYGLGAILYEILTAQPPFTGPDTPAVLRKVRTEPPVPPRQLRADVPLPLQAVCLKALAKRREDRYATAADLAADVQRWLADEPVTAFREPLTVRAGRWTRRHRTWVVGAAAAACVAVVTLSVATVLLQRARGVAEQREQEAREQRQQAQEQRDEARSKYQLARDAVDQMLTEVGHKSLRDIPGMDSVRRALLEKALTFYQQFLREKSDDPEVRRATGYAYKRMGTIYELLGKHDEALTAFRQAMELWRRLMEEFPDDLRYRSDLAWTHNDLGAVYFLTGRYPEAEAVFRQGRDLVEYLVGKAPGEADYQRLLASNAANLGLVYHRTGRTQEAIPELEKARDVYTRLVQAPAATARVRDGLATTYHGLGPLYRDLGQYPLAEAAFRQCVALWEQLLREDPQSSEYRQMLGSSHQHLGYMYQRYVARPSQAEAHYQTALKLREQLAQEHPAVPAYQLDVAQSHGTLGWLYQTSGQPDRAEAAFLSALAVHEKLQQDHPTVPRYRASVADSHHYLGGFYAAMGQSAKVEAAYLKAVEIFTRLVQEQPQTVEYRVQLGQVYHELGVFFDIHKHFDKAESGYNSASIVREELYRTQPNVPKYQEDLAWSYTNLSDLYADHKQQAKALEVLGKALPLWEKLLQAHPKSVGYAAGLGAAYSTRGDLIRDTGKPGEALDWYAKAIQVLQPAYQQEPRHEDSRNKLRGAYWGRAIALGQLTRHADAVKDWDRALQLAAASSGDTLRLKRALALVRAGELTKAVAEADALTQGEKVPGGTLYDAACIYALAATRVPEDARLAEQHAARAVTQLRRAQAAGHFKEPANATQLKNDPDLNPLRQRDDFRKLLAELEASPRPADKK
jgi:serine/threonine-protein kinase